MNYTSVILAFILMLCSCSGTATKTAATPTTKKDKAQVEFSADSAYSYADKQVAFGPRVPGTEAHDLCAAWLAERLESFGADTVSIGNGSVTAWNGDRLPVKNIFAQFNADNPVRVILLAHYDSRPWADYDTDPAKRNTPIDGANDGASGVAVLLEIARNFSTKAPEIGVDILFTDCEDYGKEQSNESWCLGAQQFAKNLPYTAHNMPRYGILLDMVGNFDAVFPQEYHSAVYAALPTSKVWDAAKNLGFEQRFPAQVGGGASDDHLPLISAGIPTTDIIECANPATGSFPPTWHTQADNMENLDRETLGVVGRVVQDVIYNEKP